MSFDTPGEHLTEDTVTHSCGGGGNGEGRGCNGGGDSGGSSSVSGGGASGSGDIGDSGGEDDFLYCSITL